MCIRDRIKAQEPEHSKKSTEEMLQHIMRVNSEILSKCKDLNDFAERYICSVDVKALYVEIKPDRAGEEIYESILEGNWIFDVDNQEMCKYIAVNWTREKIISQGLGEYIPFRTKVINGITVPNYNSKITMTSDEMNRPVGKESDGKWTKTKAVTSNDVTKKLVAATISIGVENCLINHCFSKGTQTFLQPFSGVIGLDLMRCLAEIYMLRWIHKLKAKLEEISNKPIIKVNDEAEKKMICEGNLKSAIESDTGAIVRLVVGHVCTVSYTHMPLPTTPYV